MSIIEQLVKNSTQYKGIPYLQWSLGQEEKKFFCTDRHYTLDELITRGIDSATLINIFYISLFGVPVRGEQLYDTIWWGYTLRIRQPFEQQKDYPPGTLLFRRYKSKERPGHLAMVTQKDILIHAWPESGVEQHLIKDIHWFDRQEYPTGFFEFAILPQDWLKPSLVKDRWYP